MESARSFNYMATTLSDILSSNSSDGRFEEAPPFVLFSDIGDLKEFQEAQALFSNFAYTNEMAVRDPFEMDSNECNISPNWLAVDSPDSPAVAEAILFYAQRPLQSFTDWTGLGDSSSCSSDNNFPNSFVNEYNWENGSTPLLLNSNLSSENPAMTIPCNGLASQVPHDLGLDNDVISGQSVNSDQQSWEMSTTSHNNEQKRKMVDRDILDQEQSCHGKRLCRGEQSVGIFAEEIGHTNENNSELIEDSSDDHGSKSHQDLIDSIAVGPTLNINGKPRGRRCSASDPQSVYARNRREKINERLKILQNLIPNGTKVDISTMLEQAIDYVKFMQLQIKV